VTPEGFKEIIWLTPDGREMTENDWNQAFARCVGVFLAGGAIERRGPRGRPIRDSNFLLLFNAHHETIPFRIVDTLASRAWMTVLDSAAEAPFAHEPLEAESYPLQGRSLALFEERGASRADTARLPVL
jgi:isoamylase